MASTTVSAIQPILRDMYAKMMVDVLYKNHPFLASLKKSNNFKGDTFKVPMRYSPEPGGSATFASALANRGPSGYSRFSISRRKDYAVGSIETEAVRAALGGGEGAIVDALKTVVMGLRNTASRSLAISAYRNGGGARAQATSGMASNVVQLLNPKDIVNFEVGMVLDGSAADGTSGAATAGAAAAKIVAIDRSLGTLTNDASANWNAATGINGLLANWYLFRQGDFGATIQGLDAWIPPTVTATPFNGVNRTIDEERLAGCRITPTTAGYTYSTVEGACLALLERIYLAGGAPDRIYTHPQRYRRLTEELGARRQYTKVDVEQAKISFRGILIDGQGGPATVISDPNCQKDVIWALTQDTWEMKTLGEIASVLDDDGNAAWLRESDNDSLQMRLATFGNIYCDAPAWNGRASMTGIALWRRARPSAPFGMPRPTRSFSPGASPPTRATPPPLSRARASPWPTSPRAGGPSPSRASAGPPSSRWSSVCRPTRAWSARRISP